jgi:hypothetical protein
MNRIRLLAIGAVLGFTLTAAAQQPATGADTQVEGGVPSAEVQLKMLTERLDLTGDQQARIKSILADLQAASQKFIQDESMSRDERMDNVRAWRHKTDRRIREQLNDDQKKKLDQLEQEPHPELHGNLN